MIPLPRGLQIFVAGALALSAAGCATVVPLQTASTVPKGGYRIGGSVSLAPWCSLSVRPDVNCNLDPRGTPVPELRLSARHGILDGFDLGVSAHADAVLWRGLEAGLFVDGKKELWSRPLDAAGANRQLVSVGPGVGFTAVEVLDASRRQAGVAFMDLAVPVYFGHQTQHLEWVASARFIERLAFVDRDGDRQREVDPATELGIFGGLHTRGAVRFALELGYQTSLQRPTGGLFLLSAGAFFDILPSPKTP